MVTVRGVIDERQPIRAPQNLVSVVNGVITIQLTDKEVQLITKALFALGEQIIQDGLTDLKKVNMLFTENGEATLSMLDNVLGNHLSLCLYNVGGWRERFGQDDGAILMIILEELCHHFYTDDEVLVKHKVYEVIKRMYPNVKFNNLYKDVPEP